MEAYLDNAATTRCCEEAAGLMAKVLTTDYGNPSSLHVMGARAERYVRDAARKIAKTLKVSEKEIVFTSGGTESNNLAILGGAAANQGAGRHMILTEAEHASVYRPAEHLKEQGWRVTFLPTDSFGRIRLSDLEAALDEETSLVSIMLVNNEIGTVQPVAEAARLVKKAAPRALVHCDAVQAYGKMPVYPGQMGVDLLSASGHKIHGPKGSGFLYVGNKARLSPVLFGGGQQDGLRSGTENVPAIAGLGEAAARMHAGLKEHAAQMRALRELFVSEARQMQGVTVNGAKGEDVAPHIVSVSVEGVRSEVLLHALEERGVYVSSGSACSSNRPAVSRTLLAAGLPRHLSESTARFSFCPFTTEEEVLHAVSCMREIIPFLRKFTRK